MKTAKGKYVLRRSYITYWQGEPSTSNYYLYDTMEELVNNLDATDDCDRKVLEGMQKLEDISEEV